MTPEELSKIAAREPVITIDDEGLCVQRVQLSPAERDALCTAVRHLLEEKRTKKIELLKLSGRGELLKKEHVNFDSLDEVDAVRNELYRLQQRVLELETEIDTGRGYM